MAFDLQMARIVAALMGPDRAVAGLDSRTPAAANREALVHACVSNKIPLLSLDLAAIQRDERLVPWYEGPLSQERDREHERWASQRAEYRHVREAFDAADVRDVCIKSTGAAPSLSYKSDNLDILVRCAQGNVARECLLDLGYTEIKNVEEPHKFLFRKYQGGRNVLPVHLHEFVGWGTGFLGDDAVLDAARPSADDPAVWIPSREDAILITMAHAFYEDKEIKLGDLWKVIHVLRDAPNSGARDLDWDTMVRRTQHRGWLDGLYTCIQLWAELETALYGESSFPAEIVETAREEMPAYSREYLAARFAEGEPEFPFHLSFKFSKRHYYTKVARDRALTACEKFVDALRHSLAGIKRRLPFRSQPGMLITLSGIDGSGKTVHADALKDAMEECEIDLRTVWSRSCSSRFTDRIIGLVKPLVGTPDGIDTESDTREAKTARKAVWLRRPALRFGWICLAILDLTLTYWRKVTWPLLLGRVVISDRYVYDAIVELTVLTDCQRVAEGWPAQVLRALCPRPRLAYYLNVDPAVALARKPDESVEHLEEQALVFHEMWMGWRMQAVDSNGHRDLASDRIIHEVLRSYYLDWHTLINGLFLANPIKRH